MLVLTAITGFILKAYKCRNWRLDKIFGYQIEHKNTSLTNSKFSCYMTFSSHDKGNYRDDSILSENTVRSENSACEVPKLQKQYKRN